jgi:hypothetical protein
MMPEKNNQNQNKLPSRTSTSLMAKCTTKKYRQLNLSLDPKIAEAFNAACNETGVSMTSVLSQYMGQYSAMTISKSYISAAPLLTRRKRRKALDNLISQLKVLLDAEEQAQSNTPENLVGSSNYEAYNEIIELLDEAIGLLETVYS